MREYSQRDGWWLKRRRKTKEGVLFRVPHEDSITDALYDQLEKIRHASAGNSPLSALQINFVSQTPRKKQKGIGPKALTTDLRAYIYGLDKPDLAIEAKVLFEEADLQKEYCSNRGVQRFADQDSPYTREIVGAMVGYGLTHTAVAWEEKIANALPRVDCTEQVDRARVDGESRPTVVCDIVRSDHRLPRVTVLHFVLEVITEHS